MFYPIKVVDAHSLPPSLRRPASRHLSGTILGALCMMSLVGCSVTDDAKFKGRAMKAVRAMLKDPASARFEEVRVVRTEAQGRTGPNRATTVCGLVNAKNSWGAYAGAQPFYSVARVELNFAKVERKDLVAIILNEDATPDNRAAFKEYCLG